MRPFIVRVFPSSKRLLFFFFEDKVVVWEREVRELAGTPDVNIQFLFLSLSLSLVEVVELHLMNDLPSNNTFD